MRGLSYFRRMMSIVMIYALKLIKPSDTKRIDCKKRPQLTTKSM